MSIAGEDQPFSEAHHAELDQVTDSWNSVNRTRVAAISFLGTASIGSAGLAFSQDAAALLYVSALLMALGAVAERAMYGVLVALTTRGVILQRQAMPNEPDTWLQATPTIATRLALDLAERESEERAGDLRSLRVNSPWGRVAIGGAVTTAVLGTLLGGIGVLSWF